MPDPLVALDSQGKATIISYDVPEPTSYSGRNYLQIPLPEEAFTTVVLAEAARPSEPGNPLAAETGTRGSRGPAVAESPPAAAALSRSATVAVLAPDTVVLGVGDQHASPVIRSERPLSERLAALTNADVQAAAAAGKQVVLYPDVSGRMDFRLVSARAARQQNGDGGRDGPGSDPTVPSVSVFISTPTNNSALSGSAQGVTCPVAGTWSGEDAAEMKLKVGLDGGAESEVPLLPDGSWSAPVTITAAGTHTIRATITGSGWNSGLRRQVSVRDVATATVSVTLDPGNGNPPPVLPTLRITSPADNTTLVSPAGLGTLTVSGEATWGPGGSINSIQVTDEFDGTTVQAGKVGNDWSTWSVQMLLSELGRHRITAIAIDTSRNQSAPQAVTVIVTAQQAFRRLRNRLLLVETLNLSSFLGAFGAGRVIKTFSLLPGEKTTLSIKSWTKSADSRKTGSSIVDSDATEAASDFEDTLSAEQTSKESQTEASNYKIGASVGATWGWGSASINAEYSGSANSAREEAVKNVASATRKHAMKASSNRSVTINAEYTASHEEGAEDSTTREISNINVSRTLNFVFRQMNQEHITLIHLTNVRVAYYTEDLMLDADGKPAYVTDPITGARVLDIRHDYVEVPLPQLQGLLASAITAPWQPKVQDAITFALSGIPDYQDRLQTVVEWVTPTKDGQEVPGATYMRFPRNLSTEFEDPISRQKITVPGIVLTYDHIVVRTEGVMVDTVIGQGDGLDTYSHGLQEVAIADRQMTLAERQADVDRLALARLIVQNKDKDAAELFGKLFPPRPHALPTLEVIQGPQPTDGAPRAPVS